MTPTQNPDVYYIRAIRHEFHSQEAEHLFNVETTAIKEVYLQKTLMLIPYVG